MAITSIKKITTAKETSNTSLLQDRTVNPGAGGIQLLFSICFFKRSEFVLPTRSRKDSLRQGDMLSMSNQAQKFHKWLISLNLVPFLPGMVGGRENEYHNANICHS